MGISAMQRSRRASPVLSGDWPRRCLWGLPCTSAPVPAAARLPWPLESTIRSAASAPCGPAPPPPSYESPLTPPSGERPICRSQFWLYSCRESKRLLVKSCNQIMLMAKTVVRWMMPYLHLRLECIKQFLVRLPICQFIVPRNLNLLAIPPSVSQEKRRAAVNTTV
ncbi:uncharacterized protein [Lolium perenne]|uniref:uncharacterized protein isoform X4 n=1 Tax=Lolium perenne TaxID=4522 RepID=UPI0021F6375A|nr:uncharacterized protein LOC127316573 isoform X4 [Lolium perenne]